MRFNTIFAHLAYFLGHLVVDSTEEESFQFILKYVQWHVGWT